jgi:hypothetical protein
MVEGHKVRPGYHGIPSSKREARRRLANIAAAATPTSYAVPDAVQQAARQGLALRKKHVRGGTSVGMGTARLLANGGAISPEKVRHIARYFPRHAGDNLSDKTSNGWIAWQLWGGHAARSWASALVDEMDSEDSVTAAGAVPGKRGYSKAKYPSSIGGRSPSLKWPHLYDLLRAKGYDKEKSARISNSRIGMRKSGQLKGLPWSQAESPKALSRTLKKYEKGLRKRRSLRASAGAAALLAAAIDQSQH